MSKTNEIFGFGNKEKSLTLGEMKAIIESALAKVRHWSRVLAIIPDKTRDDSTHLIFPLVNRILQEKNLAKFDALVAQGTHSPMNEAEKFTKIGFDSPHPIPFSGRIFDHEWKNPQALCVIGEISAEKVSQISNGMMNSRVSLTVNKLISAENYDYILIFGATVPHEVAGFAGGAKYFFPGVSGAELTNLTHWLGALTGIENIIGKIETPTRHLIETAADFIQPEIINFTSVVTRNSVHQLQTHALFAGDFRLSFRKAAEISRQVHIKFVDKKFKRVVAILDKHYDELWTGGKAGYKLGGIIEEGGELIIYAPHLTRISETHGAVIEKFGYAPIEKIKELTANSKELQNNLCVAAHLAHVAYAGKCDFPKDFKFRITLASQLNKETCGQLNLNFADFRQINFDELKNDSEALIVENAGRDLYLLNSK